MMEFDRNWYKTALEKSAFFLNYWLFVIGTITIGTVVVGDQQ